MHALINLCAAALKLTEPDSHTAAQVAAYEDARVGIFAAMLRTRRARMAGVQHGQQLLGSAEDMVSWLGWAFAYSKVQDRLCMAARLAAQDACQARRGGRGCCGGGRCSSGK